MARGTLTKHDYAAAAFDFVDEHGLESLTMRSLGEKMGVDPTAVYRHFPTKEGLVNALVDRLLGAVREDAAARPGDTPRDRIRNFAWAMREQVRRHPGIGVIIPVSSGESENGYFCSRMILDALADMGLRDQDLIVTYQSLEGFVMGSCVQDFTGAPRNWQIRRVRYRAFGVPGIDAAASTTDGVREIADAAFDQGLTTLIDLAAARATAG